MATNGNPETEQQRPSQAQRSGGGRGPSYPSLDIKEAIEKARTFYGAERRSAAPLASAARHWGYSETSSSGRLVVSALLQYGLMEDTGSRDNRTLKLTERGLDIVLDSEDSQKRLAAVQAAVRAPRSNAEVFTRYAPHELPSDQTLRFFLVRERGFHDNTVDGYIKSLRDSVAYARLDKPDNIPAKKADDGHKKPPADVPEVGDVIQWEAGGVLRLEAPRRVRAKSEHDGSWWVFVEGSETGIPMDETTVIERKAAEPIGGVKQPPTLALPPTAAPAIQPAAGEAEASRGKLGDGVSYRLLVTGEMGAKQVARLIKLLQAQQAVLSEDEAEL